MLADSNTNVVCGGSGKLMNFFNPFFPEQGTKFLLVRAFLYLKEIKPHHFIEKAELRA